MKALECIKVLSVFWTLPAIYGIGKTEWQASNCINSTSHHVMSFQSKISAYLHLKDTMILTANPHHLKYSTSLFKNQYTLIASLPLTNAKFQTDVTAPGLSPPWRLPRGPRLSISHMMMPSQPRQRNSSTEVCSMELIRIQTAAQLGPLILLHR